MIPKAHLKKIHEGFLGFVLIQNLNYNFTMPWAIFQREHDGRNENSQRDGSGEGKIVGWKETWTLLLGLGGDWGWFWVWGGSRNQPFLCWSLLGGASSWRRGTKTSKFQITRSAIHHTIFDVALLGGQRRDRIVDFNKPCILTFEKYIRVVVEVKRMQEEATREKERKRKL